MCVPQRAREDTNDDRKGLMGKTYKRVQRDTDVVLEREAVF